MTVGQTPQKRRQTGRLGRHVFAVAARHRDLPRRGWASDEVHTHVAPDGMDLSRRDKLAPRRNCLRREVPARAYLGRLFIPDGVGELACHVVPEMCDDTAAPNDRVRQRLEA